MRLDKITKAVIINDQVLGHPNIKKLEGKVGTKKQRLRSSSQ